MSESSDRHQTTQIFSEKRLLKVMVIVSVAAVVAASLWFRDWHVTCGLGLGCGLSVVNYRWSNKSLRAMFEKNTDAAQPRFSAAKFLFRYLIFAAIIGAAYFLDLISIVAALCGFLNFITAIFITAFIQLFTGFIKREEK